MSSVRNLLSCVLFSCISLSCAQSNETRAQNFGVKFYFLVVLFSLIVRWVPDCVSVTSLHHVHCNNDCLARKRTCSSVQLVFTRSVATVMYTVLILSLLLAVVSFCCLYLLSPLRPTSSLVLTVLCFFSCSVLFSSFEPCILPSWQSPLGICALLA